ncbi:MAG: serine/threonine-protein phosphatase [Micromonosporaceae bacterium]|nr:serine/threonine-protein phosphatase [Micromonosporaceae bacterium]
MTLTMRYAARSDRGLIRHGNQDSVYAGPRLLAVADGMGGMAAGDVASNIVIAALAPLDEDVPSNAPLDALRQAVETANQQIRAAVEQNPAMEGMGTTLTGMLFGGNKIGMVHIGDSRAYLLRDGELTQITRDDTYVQMLVDEGRITEVEANTHPQKSLLMRALDGRDTDAEYSLRQVMPGDRYLLCSDGLSGVVSDETIAATLREYADPHQCADRLVQLALRAGGPDNITVIVADFTDEDIVEEAPVVAGAAANDRGLITTADVSTPAGRASALTRSGDAVPVAEVAEDADEPVRRHPIRTVLLLLLFVAVLAGGLWGGWRYTQTKYYVGVTDDGRIAVFQGIPGEVAGFQLSQVVHLSDVSIDSLTPASQDTVRATITKDSRSEAMAALDALLDPKARNVIPECKTVTIYP